MESAEPMPRCVQPIECTDTDNGLMYRCSGCDSKFSIFEDFQKHAVQPFCKEINNLDENCMDIIFKYLSPNDLASLSMTCRRFKELAERYFYLKRETEPIYINATPRSVAFTHKSIQYYKYEKVFQSLIRSVFVMFRNANSIDVCNFIKENCATNLFAMKLVSEFGAEVAMNGTHSEILKDHLKHIRDLKLINISTNDLYQVFLRHCTSLRTLTIEYDKYAFQNHCLYGDTWLNRTYPHLETLIIGIPDFVQIDLTNFLRLNPNLKEIVCNNSSAIESLCESEAKIPSVVLIFSSEESFVSQRCKVREWCRLKNSKNFELVIPEIEEGEVIQACAKLPNLTAFHCGCNLDEIFELDICFPDIVKLCIDLTFNEPADELYDQFVKTFPNLRELRIRIDLNQDEPTKDHVLLILNRFNKLERFLLSNCDVTISENDFEAMNSVRSKLEDVPKVILYTDSDHLDVFETRGDAVTIESNLFHLGCKLCGLSSYNDPENGFEIPIEDLNHSL